ncbi:MAG TPA: helix-turn-helix transcriptional regulator [Allosphingosinicella sp.]|jgi:transcriptional regulator with XRE-family HTH domain
MPRARPLVTAFAVGLDELAAEVRARAPRRGMRKRLAHELGISQPTLSNILAGRRAPPARVLAKLGFRLRFERIE